MKNKYNLSVIIPVYNGEKYIKRCIESVKKNKIKPEIIVINDGSTDNTQKIIEEIKDIKVINLKDNKGISHARNIGIENAQGKYFTFVDCDDYVEKNIYDKLIELAEKYKLDVCGCNYNEIMKKKIKSKYDYSNEIMTKDEIIEKILTDKISLTVWDKIYRNKNIKFNEKLKINEDYLYSIQILTSSKKIMLINEYLYNYCRNKQSITSNYMCEDIKNNNYINYVNKELHDYKQYNNFLKLHEIKKINLYSNCIDKENIYKYLKKNIDKSKLRKIKNISLSKRIEVLIFRISIQMHLFLYPIYKRIRTKLRR